MKSRMSYQSQKKQEAITALTELLQRIKRGELAPIAIGMWSTGMNSRIHVKLELDDTSVEQIMGSPDEN